MYAAADHHFPKYHLRPPTGFMNDPNGPVLLADGLHLYFQYRAAASGEGPVSWGHVSSPDFVHWRYHHPAITPDPDNLNADGCWSGNTVLNAGQVVAFFSAYSAAAKFQSVMKAVSTDGGATFGPSVQAVPDPADADDIAIFRDPFVWRDVDQWRMVVGAGARDATASARLFESADLIEWAPVGTMAAMSRQQTDAGDSGAMWECPQVVTFGEENVLIVSPWAPGRELMQVLTLSGLDDRGVPATIGRLDHGANFYAASVLRSGPLGAVVWGWATEGRSDDWCVEAGWSGMITLPRSITMRPDGTVASHPLPALDALRQERIEVVREASGDLLSERVPAQAELRFDLAADPERSPVRARLRFGTDEHLDLTIDWRSETVTVDRSCASDDSRAHRNAVVFEEPACASGARLIITAYVDGSIIEIFTNSGRCATVRMYPTSPPPWRVELVGANMVDRIDCWSLRSAALSVK